MNYTYTPIIQPRPKSAALAKVGNMAHSCKALGCNNQRTGLNAYCSTHQTIHQKYGHPHGRAVGIRNYSPYRAMVGAVFEANPRHAGLSAALAYVTSWIQQSVANEGLSKAAPHMARLHQHGITPLQILTEACSLWCWLAANSHLMPTVRAENFALSRAVFALAPWTRRYTAAANAKGSTGYAVRPNPSTLDAAGSILRDGLCNFFANVSSAVAARDKQAEATLLAIQEPFKPPVAFYLAEAAGKT